MHASGTTRRVPGGNPNENDGQPARARRQVPRATSTASSPACASTRAAANTGTHVGHLWSAAGTLLAEVTFTGRDGLERLAAADVPRAGRDRSANTTYVASYHSAVRLLRLRAGLLRGAASTIRRSTRSRTARTARTASTATARRQLPDADLPGEQLLGGRRLRRRAAGLLHRLRRRRRLRRMPAVSDGQPIELGVKFQVDVPGERHARCASTRAPSNTGTHVGQPLGRRRHAARDGDLRGRERPRAGRRSALEPPVAIAAEHDLRRVLPLGVGLLRLRRRLLRRGAWRRRRCACSRAPTRAGTASILLRRAGLPRRRAATARTTGSTCASQPDAPFDAAPPQLERADPG